MVLLLFAGLLLVVLRPEGQPGLSTPASVAAAAPAADPYADILPDQREAIANETRDRLSAYRIAARVDEAAGTIGGDLAVTFRNDAGVPLREVWFRLFPNIDYYGEGGTTIANVTIGGEPAVSALGISGSALRIDLPVPLAPGGRAEIAMEFTTTVPLESIGSFGIFHRDAANATWVLADWHPVLAVYDRDIGWNLAPPSAIGDPTYAASAMFDVRIDAPARWVVVSSGVAVDRAAGDPGRAVTQLVAGPAREFTLALDDDWAATSIEQDGVTITAWTEPDRTDPASARRAVQSAAAAFASFDRLLAPYPYRELDLVDVPLAGALAVSWSGMIFLDGGAMLAGYAANDPGAFDAVIAHEVSHLWWGATVGSDSNNHPFINEGLATVSAVAALREQDHPDAEAALERWILDPAASLLAAGDAIVDLPADAPGDALARSQAIYGKAALGFLAIRAEIGDEAFRAGLRAVSHDYQFGIMTPRDLRAAWERASGQDLGPFWRTWFDSAELTAAEIAAVAESLSR